MRFGGKNSPPSVSNVDFQTSNYANDLLEESESFVTMQTRKKSMDDDMRIYKEFKLRGESEYDPYAFNFNKL